HRHANFAADDLHAVNEAEVDNIAAQLRIDDLAQSIQDQFFSNWLCIHFREGAAKGSIFERTKCAIIRATFSKSVPRLPARRTPPIRIAFPFAATMPKLIAARPDKNAK